MNSAHFCLVAIAVAVSSASAQNAGCHTGGSDRGETIQCEIPGGYTLPGTFDVSKLGGELGFVGIRGSGNVVTKNFRPLPVLPKLYGLALKGFNQLPEHGRFPFGGFLRYNKHVEILDLQDVKLLSLTEEDFGGFSKLTLLHVFNADLESVSPYAFRGMGSLKTLYITGNYQLESLDWSFLSPASKTLEYILLSDNGLKTDKLTRSSPFTLNAATTIILSSNKLKSLRAAVYETFNNKLPLAVYLSGQPICPESAECGCCEMHDFSLWMKNNNQIDAVKYISCGPEAVHTNSTTFLSIPNLYDHCLAPPRTTPAIPAGTTAPAAPVGSTAVLPTCAPCKPCSTSCPATPSIGSPVVVKCEKNQFTVPQIDVVDIEGTSAEFVGDQTRKCVNAAYDLHVWILEKADLGQQSRFALDSDDGIVVTCTGRGVISVNQHDPDDVVTSKVRMETANTVKCRQFFLEFMKLMLAF